jgi:hypothetical protein
MSLKFSAVEGNMFIFIEEKIFKHEPITWLHPKIHELRIYRRITD